MSETTDSGRKPPPNEAWWRYAAAAKHWHRARRAYSYGECSEEQCLAAKAAHDAARSDYESAMDAWREEAE